MVRPIRRDTTTAIYITPANCSSITSARAHGADRQDVAETDPGQRGEAQEQQLHPAHKGAGSALGQSAAFGLTFVLASLPGRFPWLAFGAVLQRVLHGERARRISMG